MLSCVMMMFSAKSSKFDCVRARRVHEAPNVEPAVARIERNESERIANPTLRKKEERRGRREKEWS